MWHFNKLSDEQKKSVRKYYEKRKFSEIKKIYDAAGVIPSGQCKTCRPVRQVEQWTAWAIRMKKI